MDMIFVKIKYCEYKKCKKEMRFACKYGRHKKYCSPTHRKAAWKQKHREQYNELERKRYHKKRGRISPASI